VRAFSHAHAQLAIQVAQSFAEYGKNLPLRSTVVTGGHMNAQSRSCAKGRGAGGDAGNGSSITCRTRPSCSTRYLVLDEGRSHADMDSCPISSASSPCCRRSGRTCFSRHLPRRDPPPRKTLLRTRRLQIRRNRRQLVTHVLIGAGRKNASCSPTHPRPATAPVLVFTAPASVNRLAHSCGHHIMRAIHGEQMQAERLVRWRLQVGQDQCVWRPKLHPGLA